MRRIAWARRVFAIIAVLSVAVTAAFACAELVSGTSGRPHRHHAREAVRRASPLAAPTRPEAATSAVIGVQNVTAHKLAPDSDLRLTVVPAQSVTVDNLPQDVHGACHQTVAIAGVGNACRAGNAGLMRVELPSGGSVTTHGPDGMHEAALFLAASAPQPGSARGGTTPPASLSFPPRTPLDNASVADVRCAPAGEKREVLVYAYAAGTADRTTTLTPLMRTAAYRMSRFLNDEAFAADSSAFARIKLRCDTDGLPTIITAQLPTTANSADFGTIINDLRAQGISSNLSMTSGERALVFYDHKVSDISAQATMAYDDSAGPTNLNVAGGGIAIQYATYWDQPLWQMWLHEFGHTMGAVQEFTPNSSGTGHHCNDGESVMCYGDGGSTSNYAKTACPVNLLFDCNYDDYFNPVPRNLDYLASHWNLASDANPWLDHAPTPAADAPTSPTGLQQLNAEGSPIADEAWQVDGVSTNVVIRFAATSPRSGAVLTPWVEVAPASGWFNSPCGGADPDTIRHGTAVTAPAAGADVHLTVAVSGLDDARQYRWRACVTDNNGQRSSFSVGTSFGVWRDRPIPADTVLDGLTGADVAASSATSGMSAHWTAPAGPAAAAITSEYCVTTANDCTSAVVVPWTSVGTSTSVTWSVSLLAGETYRTCQRSVSGTGARSPARCSNGVLIDRTAPAAPTNVSDGFGPGYRERDWVTSPRAYEFWFTPPSDPAGIDHFEVCVSSGVNCSGSYIGRDIYNRPDGWMETKLSNDWMFAVTPQDQFAMTCARAVDRAGNVGAIGCSNGFTVDHNLGNVANVVDGVSGTDIDDTWSWRTLHVRFDPSVDTRYQLYNHEWCVGLSEADCTWPNVGLATGRAPSTSTSFDVTADLSTGTTYVVCVQSFYRDAVVRSKPVCSDGVTAHDPVTVPPPLEVRDGTGEDISVSTNWEWVASNWTPDPSTPSGSVEWEYCIATARDCGGRRFTPGWVATLDTAAPEPPGWATAATYYTCVRASGTTTSTCSNGVTITQSLMPTAVHIGAVDDTSSVWLGTTSLTARWDVTHPNPAGDGLVNYTACISEVDNTDAVSCSAQIAGGNWRITGDATTRSYTFTGLTLESGQTYFACVAPYHTSLHYLPMTCTSVNITNLPPAPENSAVPTITGTTAVGSTLTCNPGTWSGSPTYAYAWLRDTATIGGSTTSTYDVQSADTATTLTCQVTASNAGGDVSATSAGTTIAPITCAAASVRVQVLRTVSVAASLCDELVPFTVEQTPTFGSIGALTHIYTAPTGRLGSTYMILRSQDQTHVQRVNITVTKQIVTLARPSITCGAVVPGKATCTITTTVPRLAGGGKATVVIQRRVRINGNLVWRTAATSCTAYHAKTTSCVRTLVRGAYRLRSGVVATGLHTADVSAYATRRV